MQHAPFSSSSSSFPAIGSLDDGAAALDFLDGDPDEDEAVGDGLQVLVEDRDDAIASFEAPEAHRVPPQELVLAKVCVEQLKHEDGLVRAVHLELKLVLAENGVESIVLNGVRLEYLALVARGANHAHLDIGVDNIAVLFGGIFPLDPQLLRGDYADRQGEERLAEALVRSDVPDHPLRLQEISATYAAVLLELAHVDH